MEGLTKEEFSPIVRSLIGVVLLGTGMAVLFWALKDGPKYVPSRLIPAVLFLGALSVACGLFFLYLSRLYEEGKNENNDA
jgi:hypothetical protein